jgi:hypothetical protein
MPLGFENSKLVVLTTVLSLLYLVHIRLFSLSVSPGWRKQLATRAWKNRPTGLERWVAETSTAQVKGIEGGRGQR